MIEAAGKQYDPAYTINAGRTNQEAIWIRKAAHSYGWDIMPRAVSAGLWRPVELIVHSKHEITDMYFTTLSVEPGHATLAVSYELTTDLALLPQLRLRVQGRCGESTFTYVHKVEFTAGRFLIEVPNPLLWWPRGYGNPNLYKVTTQLLQNDKVMASRQDTVGIRKLELIRTETTSIEKPGQFLFKVNGVPILVKGSNWVPADAFHSRDAARYEKILALFIDLGCNFLRSWGGNVYEDDAFFDICDRNGIMVWQDFAMACAIYPQTPEFLEVMRQEAISVVRKLRNHPSLALWSGDNEVDESYYFLRPGSRAQQDHAGGPAASGFPVRSLPALSSQLSLHVAGSHCHGKPEAHARRPFVGSARLLQEPLLHRAHGAFCERDRLPRLPGSFLDQTLR